MSFGSSFGSSALGSVFGNIASLNRSTHRSGWGYAIDPLGGLMGKAFLGDDSYQDERSLSMAKALTALQYNYAIRGLKEGPSAAKEGLISAGYNPMLAVGGAMSPASVSVGNQSPKESAQGSPIDIASAASAFASARQSLEMTEVAKQTAKVNNAATTANSAADVALKTAEAEKIRKEAESIDPVARKFFDSHPGSTSKEFYSWLKTIDDIEGMFKNHSSTSKPADSVSTHSAQSIDKGVKAIQQKFYENHTPHKRGVRKAFREDYRTRHRFDNTPLTPLQ